ncbi:MAG: ABC transporter ATP-binding protein [Clostridia bacterium]|nr:ABC transporter ATP-binding protein [Clostridia bacterium]
MSVLKLQNISKFYTSQNAVVMGLSDVSLSFDAGEFVAVTGENGSGKSTLANVLSGVLPYEGGELYFCGQPTSHYNASDWERYRRDAVSYISQDYGILPGNTVFENVESTLLLSGSSKEVSRQKTAEILKTVELSEYARRRAARLSSGQKQRLAIARALAKPSKILIADEPTGNLDRDNSEKVIKLLKEASKDRLVIVITHEYSEVENHISRHIVMSEGRVVSDRKIRPAASDNTENAREIDTSAKKTPDLKLSSYVAGLTMKARPLFCVFSVIILLLTCIASFVFIGNFVISTDDVPSRVYDASAFLNGDPRRLVISKDVEGIFTEDEIGAISGLKYVDSVEKYGYVCDVNYYYKEDVDYKKYKSRDYLPDYDKEENPDAFTLSVKVRFTNTDDPPFLQGVSRAGNLKNGRLPEGFYEVLSGDPDVKTGTRIEVFIKDRSHWAISEYISLTFDVVGEASGSGLYFSDQFLRMFNNATMNAIYRSGGVLLSGGDLGRYPVAPYEAERFKDVITDANGKAVKPAEVPRELADGEFLYPVNTLYGSMKIGDIMYLNVRNAYNEPGSLPSFSEEIGFEYVNVVNSYHLKCAGLFKSEHPRFTLVSQNTFDSMTSSLQTNQVSVFITDYAYTDRAIEEIESLGYLVISPFVQSSTRKDAALEKERINLLRISLAAAVLTLVLQVVLMRLTFSSLKDYFRLLKNIGLRKKTAYGAIAVMMLVFTLLSEIPGAAIILLLNRFGYVRVVNIFKYLEPPVLILIFAVHFLFCVISFFVAAGAIRKQVFSASESYEDIDGELLEEVTGR